MEKLVINVPDGKSSLVKQVLHSLGVTLSGQDIPVKDDYKKRLLNISSWAEEDLKPIKDAGKNFGDLKAEEW